MERFSDLDDEGSGLELVHVSDVLDYLGEYTHTVESVWEGRL